MNGADQITDGEGGGRSDLAFIAIFALFTGGVIAVDIFSVLHDRAEVGQPLPWWEPAVWEITSGLALTALLPAILWLIRRVPPRLGPPFGWIAVHFAGALAFSLVHVLAMGLLRYAAYVVVGRLYDPLRPLFDWPYELRKDLLVYVGVMVCYRLWREFRPRRTAAPAAPDVLEVRDGARRVFVPITDIRWVEAAGNYVELHTPGGAILHRASLAQMEQRLSGFVRIHRSRLVSRGAIIQVETKSTGDFAVRLASGETLAGSRRFRAELRSSAA